jgi:hypothetical protein
MYKKMIEQNIVTHKTDEGFYVEVFNDGKLVWTDTFKTKKQLNWFIKCCNNGNELGHVNVSLDEARIMLENNEYGASVFYRQPLGFRFAEIFNLEALSHKNEHGFSVHFVNNKKIMAGKVVPTIDEAFQVLKDVENGKI